MFLFPSLNGFDSRVVYLRAGSAPGRRVRFCNVTARLAMRSDVEIAVVGGSTRYEASTISNGRIGSTPVATS